MPGWADRLLPLEPPDEVVGRDRLTYWAIWLGETKTTFQPDPHFGRILAAYGGVFVAGSLAWGVLVDGFRPDRYDLLDAALCLAGWR